MLWNAEDLHSRGWVAISPAGALQTQTHRGPISESWESSISNSHTDRRWIKNTTTLLCVCYGNNNLPTCLSNFIHDPRLPSSLAHIYPSPPPFDRMTERHHLTRDKAGGCRRGETAARPPALADSFVSRVEDDRGFWSFDLTPPPPPGGHVPCRLSVGERKRGGKGETSRGRTG